MRLLNPRHWDRETVACSVLILLTIIALAVAIHHTVAVSR